MAHSLDRMIVRVLTSLDKGSFGAKEKILFFKELSYLVGGGVSLLDAMNLLITSSDNYAVRDIASTIYVYLKKGKSLSAAFNALSEYFSPGDFAIVKAGEMSGNLPVVLQSLASEYSYLNDLKNKYIGAMIYPLILFLVAVVSVIVLFVFVLPNIFMIADSFQQVKMPWITQTLRDFSVFLQTSWQAILRGAFVVGLLGFVFFSTDFGKKTWFSFLLNIPLVGTMTKYFYLVKWCRYTKMMLSSGMNYLETFSLLREILGVSIYHRMIDGVLENLQKGETIYTALQKESDIVPSDVAVMIKVGEETATLPHSFDNVLSLYDGELNTLINRLSKVIEPIMLVVIGGIVVMIALAVFGLIMQIMEGASF